MPILTIHRLWEPRRGELSHELSVLRVVLVSLSLTAVLVSCTTNTAIVPSTQREPSWLLLHQSRKATVVRTREMRVEPGPLRVAFANAAQAWIPGSGKLRLLAGEGVVLSQEPAVEEGALVWRLIAKQAGVLRLQARYQTKNFRFRTQGEIKRVGNKSLLRTWIDLEYLGSKMEHFDEITLLSDRARKLVFSGGAVVPGKTSRFVREGRERRAAETVVLQFFETDANARDSGDSKRVPAFSEKTPPKVLRTRGHTGLALDPALALELRRLPLDQLFYFDKGKRESLRGQALKRALRSGGLAGKEMDTITGKREIRELSVDQTAHRAVEEIFIRVNNFGPEPVSVLLIEPLPRLENWTIAYLSTVDAQQKLDAQTIGLTLSIPSGKRRDVVYRVVYTW